MSLGSLPAAELGLSLLGMLVGVESKLGTDGEKLSLFHGSACACQLLACRNSVWSLLFLEQAGVHGVLLNVQVATYLTERCLLLG